MQNNVFFGYGSLVNRATHDYAPGYQAQLVGWRRVWRSTTLGSDAILGVEPDENTTIKGLVAQPQGEGWQTLDKREWMYERHSITGGLSHSGPQMQSHVVYVLPNQITDPTVQRPILLSYLDVVVQGFLTEFGPEGADHFFDTTTGWDRPVLNDRASPLYPRHQALKPDETATVDRFLDRLSAQIVQR